MSTDNLEDSLEGNLEDDLEQKKKMAQFAKKIIISCGIASLYIALAISAAVNVFSIHSAMSIFLLVTVLSFILSIRYNSQIIASIATIGGYLPIISIFTMIELIDSPEETKMIYGAVYFIVFNLLALCISFKNKWRVTSFIALFLKMFGLVVNIINIIIITFQREVFLIFTVCVILTFLIYTIMPIISMIKHKRFKAEMFFLTINTIEGMIVIGYVFSAWRVYNWVR